MNHYASQAVLELRQNKLMNGHTFMISSENLPVAQCYLEYPDGRIALVTIDSNAADFHVIRFLPENECEMLRLQFGLPSILF
ncbi:MAG TPA: hypothetical protein VKR32_14900 [Puia sp.]|nr:hypothetical protein [Puia sp.]